MVRGFCRKESMLAWAARRHRSKRSVPVSLMRHCLLPPRLLLGILCIGVAAAVVADRFQLNLRIRDRSAIEIEQSIGHLYG